MSTTIDAAFDHVFADQPAQSERWDELPTDGSHAWLGLMLVLGSSIVAVRGLCWMIAHMIRLFH